MFWLSLCFFLASVGSPAHAAVALRSSGCGSGTGTTIDVASIPMAQPGDLYVATVTATAPSDAIIFQSDGSDWTWTGLGSANNGLLMATFWRYATASDPPNWTFAISGSSGTAMAYGLEVYSGADTVHDPITDADQSSSGSASASTAFPDSDGPYDGTMRFLAAGANGDVGQSISAGATSSCNQQIANASVMTAHEALGNGPTPTRTVTHTASTDAIVHSVLIRPACSAGALSVTDPSPFAFPTSTLTGIDGSASTTFQVDIDDQRAVVGGWHLTASASPFTTAGGSSLPTNAATITSAAASGGTGGCGAPMNSILYPIVLSNTAAPIYNAATSTGQGPSTLTFGTQLNYPASTQVGNYTSTWTFTVVAGP